MSASQRRAPGRSRLRIEARLTGVAHALLVGEGIISDLARIMKADFREGFREHCVDASVSVGKRQLGAVLTLTGRRPESLPYAGNIAGCRVLPEAKAGARRYLQRRDMAPLTLAVVCSLVMATDRPVGLPLTGVLVVVHDSLSVVRLGFSPEPAVDVRNVQPVQPSCVQDIGVCILAQRRIWLREDGAVHVKVQRCVE